MREILQLCVELDTKACETYGALASLSNEPELSRSFALMAKEESSHVGWWTSLLNAWDDGLLPDIADEHDLRAKLKEIEKELREPIPQDPSTLTNDDMLDIATRHEFYLLDPLFGELLDLMQPGRRRNAQESYEVHVYRLVDLIEKYYSRRAMAEFLIGVLKRGVRDQQELASIAQRDQLTGLYNRRGLLGHLGQWLSWSERYNRSLGVVLVDVDRFKLINDSFGHAAGDKALCQIGATISDTVRASDIVGRFGGDEFVVLAPEANPSELNTLMDRIVEGVNSKLFDVDGNPVTLSVSAGGSWIPGGITITPELLLAQADNSMYTAKEGGRNMASAVISPFTV